MNQTKNTFIAVLRNVTDVLLSEDLNYGELKSTLELWKDSMVHYHQLNLDEPKYNDNVYLDEGKAIATRWAAMCIDDLVRTKRFVMAAKKAVDSVLEKRPGTPVTLMYVGTGPFATLVLPLTMIYSPDQLQLDLLEVNGESFKLLRSTISAYGLEAFIRGMYHTDATEFTVERNDTDILLVECLQHALAREPQVKIIDNLVPQLKDDLILIPEEITLKLVLVDTAAQERFMLSTDSDKTNEFYEVIDDIFCLNKEEVIKSKPLFEERTNYFSEEQLRTHNRISIFTEMQLFRDEKLTYNESGLTLPLDVCDYTEASPVYGIKTKYVTGSEPGLMIELIRTPVKGP